ncbi:hypothetical protein [Pseudomonas sp. W2-17]|uniref:hypothetical protein n=1 Tax=Pseudomonas sp. W2-17 TaxID=3058039 RepID=UPI0034E063AF
MTQITEEQRALLAQTLALASSGSSNPKAAALRNPDFPAPNVPSAPGGVLLNPHLADPSGLSVEVTYPTMLVTDVIGLTFNGNNTFVPQNGSGELKVTFQVPKEEVAKAVGKTVEVTYVVVKDTGPAISQTLNLVVHLIPLDQLTEPQIVQAVGAVLDVEGLITNADIFVRAWPLIAVKQKMWMRLEGSSNLNLPDWQGYEIASASAQVATVPLSYLQGLTDGSQLTLVLEVSFDGGPPRQPFPVKTYQIKSAPAYALNALELVGAVGDVVDLSVVIGDPVVVRAPAYMGQAAGDRILLSWVGTSATGAQINYPDEYTVQAGGETGEVTFAVPRLNLDPLGGGTLQLSYQVIKVGGGTQNSPLTTYDVTAATLTLPLPAVLEATAGVLVPISVINGVTVQISYPNPLLSDVIALLWNGKGDAVLWQDGAATITFTVPPAEIGPVVGKTIDVQYAVRRGTLWSPSPALKLNVLPLMEGDFKMPKVTQATDGTLGVLDLSTFTGDAEIIIEPWPFIKEGQRVWLDMTDGTATYPILDKHQVAPGEDTRGISSLISRANLDQFPDIATIEFPAKVQLDGSDSLYGANDFPLLELQLIPIGKGSGSGSENFEEYPIGQFAATFVTKNWNFIGPAGTSTNLKHEIKLWNKTKAISLQSEWMGANFPAEMIFKTEPKPSYVEMQISVRGSSNECTATCYSSEEKEIVVLNEMSDQTLAFDHIDINRITFNSKPILSGSVEMQMTVVLDNIVWRDAR